MKVLEGKLFSFGNCKRDNQGKVDDFGLMVLRLKNYADSIALEYFLELVNSELETGVPVVAVPSSTFGKTDSGIMKLAKMLSKQGYERIDATSCLVRKVSVKPNHMGGERSITKHLNSIEVVNQYLIKGQIVILLDDVCTSGNTLTACTQLLMEAGAAEVKQYALLRDDPKEYYTNAN